MPRILGGMHQHISLFNGAMDSTDEGDDSSTQQPRPGFPRALLPRRPSFGRSGRLFSAAVAQRGLQAPHEVEAIQQNADIAAQVSPSSSAVDQHFQQAASRTGLDSWDNGGDASPSSHADESGPEWEVVSASFDESGESHDLAAGLGVQPDVAAAAADCSSSERLSSGPATVKNAEDEKVLTPAWPLSLYPPCSSRAAPGSTADEGSSRGSLDLGDAFMAASVLTQQRVDGSLYGGDADMAAAASAEGVSHRAVREEDGTGMSSSSSDGVHDSGRQNGREPLASQSSLEDPAAQEGQRGRQQAVGTSGPPVRSANNAVPAEPLSRFSVVRQTAARAGKVMLGASAFGARVRSLSSSHPWQTSGIVAPTLENPRVGYLSKIIILSSVSCAVCGS